MADKYEAPTLEKLNATDNPKDFGGECLADDGQGNELWLFRSIDKVANRWQGDDGSVEWSDDIEGWNYTDEFALICAGLIMTANFTRAVKAKGWQMQEVAERWGVTPRQLSRIAASPKQIHWDALAGLPQKERAQSI